jgi:sortase A
MTFMLRSALMSAFDGVKRRVGQLSWRQVIALGCLALGMYHLAAGGYIHAKAVLAQGLLEHAWQQTMQHGQPHKPWAWADTYPVFRLEAPVQEQDFVVLAGASGRNLAFAPSYMLASPLPGQVGKTVIAGHRDTHFRFVKDVNIGDPLHITLEDGSVQMFTVSDLQIVDIHQTPLRLTSQRSQLVLVTCYPLEAISAPGSLRYLVVAEQTDVTQSAN